MDHESSLTVPEGDGGPGFGLKQAEPLLAQTRESQQAAASERVKMKSPANA